MNHINFRLFDTLLQIKESKYEKAINYLIYYKNEFIDKTMIYKIIIINANNTKKLISD